MPAKSQYAKATTVSVEKSRIEIENSLKRYGADQFASGWQHGKATIGFRCSGCFVKFTLPLPDPTDKVFWRNPRSRYKDRSASAAARAYEAEERRRWRALSLVIKAKLEAVSSGIATFVDEFLAHILLPDGREVGEVIKPQIAESYSSGKMPLLLGPPAVAATTREE